jgi:hypothetical protein
MVNKTLLAGLFVVILGVTCLVAQDTDNSGANNGDSAKAAGTWQMQWQGRRGQQNGTLQIQQDGSKLSGTFQMMGRSAPLSGNIDGNKVSFSASGERRSLAFTGTLDGNKMSGTTERGAPWNATRQ